MGLTRKQQMFVTEYLQCFNATQAAIRAGYSAKTAHSIGSENLAKDYIVARVEEMISQLSEGTLEQARSMLRESRCSKHRSPTETLYIIMDSHGSYKIGVTGDLARRLKTLRTANPYDLRVVFSLSGEGVLAIERDLHRVFAEKRINSEWFLLSDEDVEFVRNKYVSKQ